MELVRSAAMALLLFASLWIAPTLGVVDDKCAACKAVAIELEESLANERPRNHLDYRHRLDSKGQREGKVIDYRVSELRVVELLDGLCAKMKPYVPSKVAPGETIWLKVDGGVPDAPEMALNRQHSEMHSRAIVEFCGRLLETTEEELTEKIRVGDVGTGDVEQVLCQELSRSCQKTSETTTPDANEDDSEEDEDERGLGEDIINSGTQDQSEERGDSKASSQVDVGVNPVESISMGSDVGGNCKSESLMSLVTAEVPTPDFRKMKPQQLDCLGRAAMCTPRGTLMTRETYVKLSCGNCSHRI